MRKVVLLLICIANMYSAKSQTSASSIEEWVLAIPPVIKNIDTAGKVFARGQVNPYQLLQKKLKDELLQLAGKSGRKSYLLALLSDTYDGTVRYDHERVGYDRGLIAKQQEVSLEVSAAFDAFTRHQSDNARILSISEFITRQSLTEYLKAADKDFSELRQTLLGSLEKLDLYCQQKGFRKLAAEGNINQPHFVQALEARGFLLNHVRQLLDISKSYGEMAAKWLQDCKTLPSGCN